MERNLASCLNAHLLSHNNTTDEDMQERIRRDLRRILESARLRIFNPGTKKEFDEEATVINMGFHFDDGKIDTVKIETNLGRLNGQGLLGFDYDHNKIKVAAAVRVKTQKEGRTYEDVVRIEVEVYFTDDRI